MKDSIFRSVIKAITWRITATVITVLLIFAFTKDITIALSAGALEIILKMFGYYIHERCWNKSKWGTKNGK